MVYVFVFLGEFGYELLNWHAVVRKFAGSLGPDDRIVCCGRPGLRLLYERAADYIDISKVRLFQESRACGYFAILPYDTHLNSRKNVRLDQKLTKQITAYVLDRLGLGTMGKQATFIFSSQKTVMNGCIFGADRSTFVSQRDGDIYDQLDLNNNVFKQLTPEWDLRNEIEDTLEIDLRNPFVLCQERRRDVVVRSLTSLDKQMLIEKLARQIPVVLMSFKTGRKLDSYSSFHEIPNCLTYRASSLAAQSCLIHFARHCLFFSEGDFGSHIYLPPLMGKDVTAVIPSDMLRLGTTPIGFWNESIFRFGGQIKPKIAEEVLTSRESVQSLVDEIVGLCSLSG